MCTDNLNLPRRFDSKAIEFLLSTFLLLVCTTTLLGQDNADHDFRRHPLGCGVNGELTKEGRSLLARSYRDWVGVKRRNAESGVSEFTIPVVFHLIGDATNRTDEELASALVHLNATFAGTNEGTGTMIDTRISFCLAQKGPDGSITSGITRTPSAYGHFDIDLETAKLQTMVQWDPRHYLNIWVVDHINSELYAFYTGRTWWTRERIAGFGSLPTNVITLAHQSDGVVVESLDILTHECGHYLGLLHTFEGGCKNDNCMVDGDMVCDTPPDREFMSSCGKNSCATDTLSNFSNGHFTSDTLDMASNWMDYGNNNCVGDFSEGQAERMRFHLSQFRVDLFQESETSTSACQPPCDSDISIYFEQVNGLPTSNELIHFVSEGPVLDQYRWFVEYLGPPTSDYSIAWSEGYRPGEPALSDSKDFSHTFSSVGKYRVYLRAWLEEDSTCFASYQKIVRVTCGVDARFYPDKRFIASKRPRALLFDSVTFTNRSRGASEYLWKISHSNWVSGRPDLPDFYSPEVHLTYQFAEPGEYKISLVASQGDCSDSTLVFNLPVVDPTMDGSVAVSGIFCDQADSLRLAFKVHNTGYDTINVGTPISFYLGNPLSESNEVIRLKTVLLPDIVYGFDSASFLINLAVDFSQLPDVHVIFNDAGEQELPLIFPPPDENVFSFNTIFPTSGYAELTYDNNATEYAGPVIADSSNYADRWACEGELISLELEEDAETITWLSAKRGVLGDSAILQYLVTEEDSIFALLTFAGECVQRDTISIRLSQPDVNVSPRQTSIPRGGSVQLFAGGGESYTWSPIIGLNNPHTARPLASPVTNTEYIVSVADSIGCIGLDSVNVYVENSAFIPTLFTPNSDGQNDFLKVYDLLDVEDITLQIYNRHGSLIYHSSEPDHMISQGWDGTWRGENQPIGAYYWKVEGSYLDGRAIYLNGKKQGVVHLIR